jgi:hypothetical protein
MKHTYSDGFIKMTAKDYDVSFEVAKDIIEKYPNNFYQELEWYIEKRSINQRD